MLALGKELHDPAPFEALQILCYRNRQTVSHVVKCGGVDVVKELLMSKSTSPEVTSALCFLLTSMVAFNMEIQKDVMASGVVPRLIFFLMSDDDDLGSSRGDTRPGSIRARAATVLRNLCHNEELHDQLNQMGAAEALSRIISSEKDAATKVNAAVALACLVGREELDTEDAEGQATQVPVLENSVVCQLIDVMANAAEGKMAHGIFWTVWKLAMGLASLSTPEGMKELILDAGGVDVLGTVLFTRHHENEKAHLYAARAIWNLAFNERCRREICGNAAIVGALRETLATSDSSATKEAAKGALWTLGLKEDVDSLHEVGRFGVESGTEQQHIMLSYEWSSQQSVLLVKNELSKAGYRTWMDVDRMSGSTLEAMATAVEQSAVVVVCVSKKYKESQACRTEAEYAFQQKKRIIPLLMEPDYRPSGWLGALLGTKLYFNVSSAREIPTRMQGVIKEIGSTALMGQKEVFTSAKLAVEGNVDRADQWDEDEVERWLIKIKMQDHVDTFRENAIDGTALAGLWRMSHEPRLFDEVLQEHLNVTKLGERLRLLEELAKVFE